MTPSRRSTPSAAATSSPTSTAAATATTPGHPGHQLAQRRRPSSSGSQAVLRGAALGDPRIVVRPVEPPTTPAPGWSGAPHRRAVPAARGAPATGFRLTRPGRSVGRRRARTSPPTGRRHRRAARRRRDVRRPAGRSAGDVAVIVATRDARAAWSTTRSPTPGSRPSWPVAATSSTPAADDWLALLEALEQPHRSARVRAAAMTAFFGRTADELVRAGDDLTDRVADDAAGLGAAAAQPRGRRALRGGRRARPDGPGARRRPRASGGSPTCGTSPSCCTRPPSASGSASLRCCTGSGQERLRNAAHDRAHPPARQRRRRRADRDGPRQQGPAVPRRLPAVRASRSTSTPSRPRCSTTTPGRAPSTSPEAGAELGRRTSGGTRPRSSARSSGCSTSR